MAEIVVVGAGPVGLWTALQIKDRIPEKEIVMLEKRANGYPRTHHLKISPFSLPKVGPDSHIYEIVQFLKKNRNPRTNELEEKLSSKATAAGIKIVRNSPFTDQKELLQLYPEAKVVIGADGAHSLFRKQIFGERLSLEHDLHCVVELKYQLKGRAERDLGPARLHRNIGTNAFTRRFVGSYDAATDTTPITIRSFISRKAYGNLVDWTNYRNPKSLTDLQARDPDLHMRFTQWLKDTEDGEKLVPGSSKVTVTKLGTYLSPQLVKTSEKVHFIVVGDAAHGVPFFRNLNIGLVAGTKLAQCLSQKFKPQRRWKIFTEPLAHYEAYVRRMAKWEILAARVKSFFIRIYIRFVSSNWKIVRIIGRVGLAFHKPAEYLDELAYKYRRVFFR